MAHLLSYEVSKFAAACEELISSMPAKALTDNERQVVTYYLYEIGLKIEEAIAVSKSLDTREPAIIKGL